MAVDWQLRESGPNDAEHTVLLLPGGMCSAGSYAEVMAQPPARRLENVLKGAPGADRAEQQHAGVPGPVVS
jgi:hypothetical protein